MDSIYIRDIVDPRFPWISENRKPRVYFAGKVKKHGFRHQIFHDQIMATHGENERMIYAGPSAISFEHGQGCWHSFNSLHGTTLVKRGSLAIEGEENISRWIRSTLVDPTDSRSLPRKEKIVERCFSQISGSDAVYAYIDSTDCFGTIAELGYASAIGKPIFLVFHPKLNTEIELDSYHYPEYFHKDELWFIKSLPSVVSIEYSEEPVIDLKLLTYLPQTGKIYIIKATGTNRIKIGFSDDPEKRLKQLSTGSPYPLQLWKVFKGTQQQEKQIHAKFAEYRVTGEWFELDGDLAQWLLTQSGDKVTI